MTVSAIQNGRSTKRRRDKGLVLIAAYKLVIVIFFALVGIGARRLIGRDVGDLFTSFVNNMHFPESRVIDFLIDKASLIDDHMLRRIGMGAFSYAGLSALEAIGLYLEKAWGEYLTLLITASFLPFEILEILHRVTWLRVGLFAINLAVLVYLIVVVIERQKRSRTAHQSRADG